MPSSTVSSGATTRIIPKLSKISPLAGFKRLFGQAAWVNFGKGLAKLAMVGAVLVSCCGRSARRSPSSLGRHRRHSDFTFWLIVKLLASSLVILTFVALADWLYQRHAWYERQRMTIQELKEEFKQSEGNPEIKAKIRQMRRQRRQAHDGECAEGLRGHHQPDPLRGGAATRPAWARRSASPRASMPWP